MNENSKKRIMVVDDEASVLITYRLILEQQGYTVALQHVFRSDSRA